MTFPRDQARIATYSEQFGSGSMNITSAMAELADRIAAVNDSLHCFISECDRDERLRKEAKQATERATDDTLSLAGVPVGIKDIIHVNGLPTRAGSALPPRFFAGEEATCVARLREAGAIIAGKTVTTEFAGMAPALTRNPHNLQHTPGGSSSGSAAAVAAGLVPLALGTQTGGSVIRPAAFCGIYGMKPSFNRIPRDGVIDRSVSVDHVGMFTQDIDGIRRSAPVLCTDWSGTPDPPGRPVRIGVPAGPYLDQAREVGLHCFEQHLQKLDAAGCEIHHISIPTFESFDRLDKRHQRLVAAEIAAMHDPWYQEYWRFYRTPMANTIEEGRDVTEQEIEEGRASRLALRTEVDRLFETHDLDCWIAPAARGPAPSSIRTTGDPVMNRPWTHAGVPVLAMPAGTAPNGLPVGVQIIGSFEDDEVLVSIAQTLAAILDPQVDTAEEEAS